MHIAIRRRLGTPLLLALLFLLPLPAAAQRFPAEADLRTMLRYIVEDGESPGVVFGVLDTDGSTRTVSYGSTGPDGRPVNAGSVFEIGPLTMTFTATLLADMVARGEVVLDDPVSKYLPDGVAVPSLRGRAITLGDLATHRSGLPSEPPDPPADLTVEDLYAFLADYELDYVPGLRYEFSSLGYGLLGHALARAAGAALPELLRQRVLEPLGMETTGYALPGGAADRATAAMRGATGLYSTAEDLLRFVEANARPAGSPLERAVRMAQEIRVERGAPDEEVGYGFSWRTLSVGHQPPIPAHGGDTDGSSARIAFDPRQGTGTVLLASTPGFHDWVWRSLLFPEPPSSQRAVHIDPAVLERYAGTYEAAVGRGRYYIRLEDEGYLTYQPRGKVRARLYATSDTSFYLLRGPHAFTFRRVGDDLQMTTRVDEREPEFEGRDWRAWKADDDTPPPEVVARNAGFWVAWGTRTWVLVAVLGATTLAGILRPLWPGRGGTA